MRSVGRAADYHATIGDVLGPSAHGDLSLENAMNHLARFVFDTEGQDLIEYALLALTIALGIYVGMQTLRGGLQNHFTDVSTTVNGS